MKPLRRLAFAIALLTVATGCDVLRDIPTTPAEAMRAADNVSLASREQVEVTDEGTVYRILVEARRPASWDDAHRAGWRDLRHDCPDGQFARELSREPVRTSIEESRRQHPKGTTFVRTVLCPPKPAFEFALPPGLDQAEAQAQMRARLMEFDQSQGQLVMVAPLITSEWSSLYMQAQHLLGAMAWSQSGECEQGFIVSNVMIGTVAAPPGEGPGRAPDGYLGFILGCADATPVAQWDNDGPAP